MELQNTVKEALNALYHHPDDTVRLQADRWLQDFQRTLDAWQVLRYPLFASWSQRVSLGIGSLGIRFVSRRLLVFLFFYVWFICDRFRRYLWYAWFYFAVLLMELDLRSSQVDVWIAFEKLVHVRFSNVAFFECVSLRARFWNLSSGPLFFLGSWKPWMVCLVA